MKEFTPTVSMVAAAKYVFVAMAVVETVQPIVEGYQRSILRDLGWAHVDPSRSWTLPINVFEAYDKRCKMARDASGLKVENPDFCPLLVAGHSLVKARRRLVEAMEPITGIGPDGLLCLGLSERDQYVELLLRLLAPYVKEVL